MRSVAWVAAGMALAMASGFAVAAQSEERNVAPSAKPAEVSFQFDRPGVPVPSFLLRVDEEGKGSYQAEEVEGPGDRGDVKYPSARHIERTLNLPPATVTKIFKAARESGHFNIDCDAKGKKIADTGKKTLSYSGTDGSGSCTFNYSENKDVQMLTSTFIGVAFTLDEGRRLSFLHQYDRLGLDAEMTALQHETAAGQALELGTIESVLTSIAGDNAVMQRVRLQAVRLLKQAGSTTGVATTYKPSG